MNILHALFGHPAIRKLSPEQNKEVKRLLAELVKIGRLEDFLSLHRGGDYDRNYHHKRAREIGARLNEIGGHELMQAARAHIKGKLDPVMAEHLDYCWMEIGDWQA
jgi:RNA processing factor Prp31